ncbi:FAD/NAD(P)-binding domain-containing protein [Favolaschia claudopus]|uniref:FAD/NAD(P)-binding domain-containing protein n=1 Tax=Favolaschia claudopus TaxID=2862362 RepID=A0AAW0CLX6_9AGAR
MIYCNKLAQNIRIPKSNASILRVRSALANFSCSVTKTSRRHFHDSGRIKAGIRASGVDADAAAGQLNIAVVGAGLVGLATSAMLRKAGHRITIFESSEFHAELGAGIVLPPNGSNVIRKLLPEARWPNIQAVDMRSMEMLHVSGSHIETEDLSEGWTKYPQGYYMVHRVDLHKEMMRLALAPDAMTLPPATVRLGAAIKEINFDTEHPSVTTSTGEQHKFDLVLGTDGIRSTVRKCMLGAEYDAPATQLAHYRWMIDLAEHPSLSWIVKDRASSGPLMFVGGDKVLALIGYPVRGGKLVNCSAAHLDPRDQDSVGWNVSVDRAALQEAFSDWGEKGKTLVDVAKNPGSWQLRKLPKLPTWRKGNVVILGDAAHAMFPTYGQGFAVGLEDAATLATLLPAGTKPAEVNARLSIFEQLRKPRAEYVSQMSSDAYKPPEEQGETGGFLGWLHPEFMEYDPVKEAQAALGKN